MKRIITKYATSSGVTVEEARNAGTSEMRGKLFYVGDDGVEYRQCVWRNDCHGDKFSAEVRVRELFKKRRASLKKSLQNLDFKEREAMKAVSNSGFPLFS